MLRIKNIVNVIFHYMYNIVENTACIDIHPGKKLIHKAELELLPAADDIGCHVCADKLNLAAVTVNSLPCQITFTDKPVHIHRHKISLKLTHLNYVACSTVRRIIGKKHKYVKCGLRQIKLLTKWSAHGVVGKRELSCKFDIYEAGIGFQGVTSFLNLHI